jgi:hypothetical protein
MQWPGEREKEFTGVAAALIPGSTPGGGEPDCDGSSADLAASLIQCADTGSTDGNIGKYVRIQLSSYPTFPSRRLFGNAGGAYSGSTLPFPRRELVRIHRGSCRAGRSRLFLSILPSMEMCIAGRLPSLHHESPRDRNHPEGTLH